MSKPVAAAVGRTTERSTAAAQRASAGEHVVLALSREQVEQVVRAASGAGNISVLLSGLTDVPNMLDRIDLPRVSTSVLHGLLVLAALPRDGSFLRNAEVARALGMEKSTAHRYLQTLMAVGLVEHDPSTRRYRRAQ